MDWPADIVWYQVFPERFRNGNPANDPTYKSLHQPAYPSEAWRPSSWTNDWYHREAWEKELGDDFYRHGVFDRRYGGDLRGVIEKLDYLADLGVNGIYFNPLFHARSLHKYDGSSFHHIDPYFGPDPEGDLGLIEGETADPSTWTWSAADRLFLELLSEAHRRGIRVIIDGVFNHTGRDFFAFTDLRKNQEKSGYRDWYSVKRFDDPRTRRNEFAYEAWHGSKDLPVFARNPRGSDLRAGPKEYIFAVTRRWMDPNEDGDPSDGVDGWRLDVADEMPRKFWRDWNRHARAINPRVYTVAETWGNPGILIRLGRFTAGMNYYGFAVPVKGFFIDGKLSASGFAEKLNAARDKLPAKSVHFVQNLIDSHDTDRVASMIVNGETTRTISSAALRTSMGLSRIRCRSPG